MNTNELAANFKLPQTTWPFLVESALSIFELFKITIDDVSECVFPWELLNLLRTEMDKALLENNISPQAEIANNSHIEGPVWIEEGVRVLPYSVIIGPVYIGRNSLIGNYTQVRNSLLGSNSLVGANTEIVRSVCLSGCSFHRNYVGDSLLGGNVNMGGDSALANVRLDRGNVFSSIDNELVDTGMKSLGAIIGKNTNIAGKAVIMPGVKIGNSSLVGPGVILFRDLPDHKKIRVVQDQQITQI